MQYIILFPSVTTCLWLRPVCFSLEAENQNDRKVANYIIY
jgi:hypothetical protein